MNVTTKKILKVFIVILGIISVMLFYISNLFSDMGECFIDAGPFYGNKIEINLDTISIDETIDIPNGKLAFANTQDSLSPLFIKLNEQNEVIWSYQLHTDEDDVLTLYQMGNMQLSENHTINFFNHSFSEPGSIHLDENYDFECVCLKVF